LYKNYLSHLGNKILNSQIDTKLWFCQQEASFCLEWHFSSIWIWKVRYWYF